MSCIAKRLLPAVFVLIIVGTLSPRPAAAVEASPYGVNIHTPSGEELTFLLDQLQEAGIGWVRIDFLWTWVQPAPDVWDWSVYDALVAAAQARGIEIYASIGETPDWATSGIPRFGVPDNPAVWADFCARAANRYRGKIRHWGLWNEPNLSKFWQGSRQQYIDVLLKPGADAIHAADPTALVGGPDLAHLTAGDADWYDWLRDVLRQAGDRLDFVTHHVYDSDGSRDVTDRLDGSTVFANKPDFWDIVSPSLREVLKYAGWSGKPVWLTETGWESKAVGEGIQAAHYGGLLEDWFTGRPNRGWISKVFFYELKDGTAPDSPSWGILRPDRTAKPAYDTYRDFIAAHQVTVDDAVPVSSTFPTAMETGQTLNVRLTYKNTGTTTWTATDGYKLGAVGDVDLFTEPRQLLAGSDSIDPDEQKAFVFSITAPNAPGTYVVRWRMLREGINQFGTIFEQEIVVTPAPSLAERALGLLGGRFSVEVSWRDPGSGRAGFGRAVPDTNQSGFFWFFGPTNLELVVKVLDGRPLNRSFWVFYGALSNVEYWIKVTDQQTGASKQYHNPPGSYCGKADTTAFREATMARTTGTTTTSLSLESLPSLESFSPAEASASCVPNAQTLCLLGSRFRVTVDWHDHLNRTGKGIAVSRSDGSGTFWFFDVANTELVVKVLDGRVLNNKYWFFYGALSDVEYTITVRDTVSGSVKRYRNKSGNLCGRADTAAF